MAIQQEKLAHLRRQAETILKHVVETPHITHQNIDELVHELNVYHVELELQLEELQRAYQGADTAHQRYMKLFDFAPLGYIETDPQGIVLRANLTASSLLGVERNALENTHFAGFITIDSTPVYAVIYIDGKKYGETPLVNIKLAPGKHSVRAVSPSGSTRNLSITIEAGKTAPVRRIEW